MIRQSLAGRLVIHINHYVCSSHVDSRTACEYGGEAVRECSAETAFELPAGSLSGEKAELEGDNDFHGYESRLWRQHKDGTPPAVNFMSKPKSKWENKEL